MTQAFCGVASSITVLNASAAPKPLTDPYKPYPYFTQCNIFNAKAKQRLDLNTVSNEGLTLAQATWLLNAQAGVRATCFHAGRADGPAVGQGVPGCEVAHSARPIPQHRPARAEPAAALSPGQLLARHAQRRQQGRRPLLPARRLQRQADDLLLMDVARYKYPPFWVDTDLLWQAMATTDTSSGRHRGYIVVEVEP